MMENRSVCEKCNKKVIFCRCFIFFDQNSTSLRSSNIAGNERNFCNRVSEHLFTDFNTNRSNLAFCGVLDEVNDNVSCNYFGIENFNSSFTKSKGLSCQY